MTNLAPQLLPVVRLFAWVATGLFACADVSQARFTIQGNESVLTTLSQLREEHVAPYSDRTCNKKTGNVVVPPMVENLTYDVAGRLEQDAFWTYAWDGPGRLTGMTRKAGTFAEANLMGQKVAFGYDADGRRTSKTHTRTYQGGLVKVESSKVLWAGWLPVLEMRSKDGILQDRRWFQWGADVSGTLEGAGGIGGLVAIIEETAAGAVTRTLLPVQDGLGNVTAVLNAANGYTVARYEFGPFGEPLGESGAVDACPFRFQTKWYDAESQHYYFGYRHYDPRLGRWLSRDPLGEAGGFNLYGYCGNDPVNRHDPLGLNPLDVARANWIHAMDYGTEEEQAAAAAAMTFLPGDPRLSPTSSVQRILGALAGSLIGPSEADRALSPAAPLGSGFGHQASLYGSSFYNSTVGMISLGSDPSRLLTGQQSIGAQLINEQYLRNFTYGERSAADFNLFVGSLAAPWAAGKVGQMAEGSFGALRGFSLAGDGIAGQGMMRGSLFASEAGAIDVLSGAVPKASVTDFVLGPSSPLRKVVWRPFENQKWGLRPKHLNKHFFGNSTFALKQMIREEAQRSGFNI